MRSCVIPFSGFYESFHDDALDRALESIFQKENGDPRKELVYRAFDMIEWKEAQNKYAAAYAANFAEEFGIKGVEFECLNSPREYNFTTDRVFVLIPDSELVRIYDSVNEETLDQVAKEMFTSRSGFISFYSPRYWEWGPFEKWDHNHLYALITAHVRDNFTGREGFDAYAEFDLMERDLCNGQLEDWILTSVYPEKQQDMDRLLNVYSYLRRREERAWACV